MKGLNLGLKVMKRLFVVFLVLGFLVNLSVYASIGKDDKDSTIGNWLTNNLKDSGNFVTNAYSNVINLVHKTTGSLKKTAYKKMQSIMNSEIVISLLGLIIFFWLYKLLKNGGNISKEEIYKALTFCIIFAFVYVILNSITAFEEVMNMFKLPSRMLQEVFGGQDFVKNALVNVFGKPFMETFNVFVALYNNYTDKVSFFGTQYLTGIPFSFALMCLYMLYILVALAVMIGVVVMQTYSIFLEGIYTAFAPIVILLLLIPQTKSIFFAWVKSYIGITLYIPLSGIAIKILSANPAKMPIGDEAIYALFIFSMTGLLLAVLAVSILSKIPTWISELLGVANQGVGMGGAIGMARMAGDGVGKAAMQGFSAQKGVANIAGKGLGAVGKGLGNFGNNLMSQTQTGQKLSSMASNASSAIKNSTVGQKMSQMKDGFNSKAQWFTNKMPPPKK